MAAAAQGEGGRGSGGLLVARRVLGDEAYVRESPILPAQRLLFSHAANSLAPALPARSPGFASRTLPRCTCAAANFVRRAYVINLDHRVHGERFRLMAAQLDRSCLEWELWPGIEPSLATFDALGRLLPSNMRANRSLFNAMVLGDERGQDRPRDAVGDIVRQPAAEGGTGAFLILEDDLWLAPDWQALLRRRAPQPARRLGYPAGGVVRLALRVGRGQRARRRRRPLEIPPDTVARPGSLTRGRARVWLKKPRQLKGTATYLGLHGARDGARPRLPAAARPRIGVRRDGAAASRSTLRACAPAAELRAARRRTNWDNPRLIAWHVSGKHNKIRELQSKVYAKWTPDWHCLANRAKGGVTLG